MRLLCARGATWDSWRCGGLVLLLLQAGAGGQHVAPYTWSLCLLSMMSEHNPVKVVTSQTFICRNCGYGCVLLNSVRAANLVGINSCCVLVAAVCLQALCHRAAVSR
jgi:hypothetical protein